MWTRRGSLDLPRRGALVVAVALTSVSARASAQATPVRSTNAATTSSPPLPTKRHAWTDNQWTGLGAYLMSAGVCMAGGAGLALRSEQRPGNPHADDFWYVVGLTMFASASTTVVTAPLIVATKTPAHPDAPLAPSAFFVGAGAIALGGGAVGVGTMATVNDPADTPWDDARGGAIAAGAIVAAFGVGLVLIGAADAGMKDDEPARRGAGAGAALRIGPGAVTLGGAL